MSNKKLKKEKQQINLVSLNDLLKGRNWEDLTKKERTEICQKIVKLIKKGVD